MMNVSPLFPPKEMDLSPLSPAGFFLFQAIASKKFLVAATVGYNT
jgi:hypothetical protein